jgi:S-disulfanyl-L-cysteine oxidoreductase SoxD
MSSSRDRRAFGHPLGHERARRAALVLALTSGMAGLVQAAPAAMLEGLGRPATPREIAAWDIDVRPDLKGLPPGRGTVAKGQELWEAKCASCHGVFGESNQTFTPLIGGTTAADVQRGRVARLTDEGFPQRTTMMKLSTVSTLWDYIYRAMPWNEPKSLSPDEVYAVTAFMLNLAGVVPDGFTLSHENMAEVQKRLPNRDGKTTEHAMWPGRTMGRPGAVDMRAAACMARCEAALTIASSLPEHARDSHGNLAQQNRLVGAQLGADTTRPAATTLVMSAAAARSAAPATTASTMAATTMPPGAAAPGAVAPAHAATQALARKSNCLTCHGVDHKIVGPGLREIGRKHAERADRLDYFARKIVEGGSGVWGPIPMPAQTLPTADARALAAWIAAGAP